MNACSSSTRVFCLKNGLTLIEGVPSGTYRWQGILSIDLAQPTWFGPKLTWFNSNGYIPTHIWVRPNFGTQAMCVACLRRVDIMS
jgi:hypothetical protein